MASVAGLLSRKRSKKEIATVNNATPEPEEKFDAVEAERIISILDDTTEKLSFLDSITPDVLQHRDELSKFIGDEIARTMNEQKALEARYEELIEQRAAMKGMVNKTKYKEIQEEIQDVSRALRESTNNLVRSLKENPNVSGNLIKVQRDRMELRDLLMRCVQELRDHGTYHAITYKVDEENNARLRFQQLRSREKGLREAVSKLEETLQQEQYAFQKQVSEQKQAISQLKEELQNVKGSTSIDARFKKKESLAYVSAIWRENKLKERVLEVRLKELEDKLQTEHVVHQQTKEFLTTKHSTLSEEVSTWEKKYDTDVGEMDNQIRRLNNKRIILTEKLSALQERRKKEIEDIDKAQMETERISTVRQRREAEERRQHAASRVIQAKLRQYLKRKKEIEAIKGESKKKSTKGKGKKGSKK
mmetsp:Transcript_25156/g.25357  ORF Transcript_25156/g.25357 Transcript_25156/m.25357 type:complete len:419 (+) Transcript_25156:140-1396(+)|eukprot:CAMPEP_0182430552 /NCGR_PEP_ID=MMETSP1167-20130531/41556_1 /TAXON_ID=2988 /ORGANISM="Mallomonas Sp, Strain CCMP3275" /LENGTH=418 /DNA_ID=CAMNT_0024615787 /DNA_START=16 /DNA_END=1275 /DNA_ORIENTATION=+